ncbi:MAG: ABC transporter substrate-binding protein [Deltaproteobacteria bacterium]|nr:ABC transporter substrate-binding protein [Deltaproteobacteria bacterium]
MKQRAHLTLINAIAAMCAVGASLGVGLAYESAPTKSAGTFTGQLVDLPASACVDRVSPCRGLYDASDTPVPVKHFSRVASGNIVADGLLLALAEPDRIAAFSPYANELAANHRFAGRPHLAALEDVEGLLNLQPDLFIVSSMSDRAHIRRLRDAGVAVFDLGPMEGLSTLQGNINTLSQLLGAPERGQALLAQVNRRLDALARGGRLPWRAIYVGIHGDKMYGGTVGSSLHDVIVAAGLQDAAEAKFHGWPAYTHEDLLAIDPDVVLTQVGMGTKLCKHPGLDQLTACRKPDRFVELPASLLTDPGLAVIDAAEALASIIRQRALAP